MPHDAELDWLSENTIAIAQLSLHGYRTGDMALNYGHGDMALNYGHGDMALNYGHGDMALN